MVSRKKGKIVTLLCFALSAVLASGYTFSAKCEYVVNNTWAENFDAEIRITNTDNQPIVGWEVSWFYENSTITSSWNANISGTYTATPYSWNNLIQPNESISFGFQGSAADGSVEVPEIMGDICDNAQNDVNYFDDALWRIVSRIDRSTLSPQLSTSLIGRGYLADDDQHWRIVSKGGNTYEFQSAASGDCLVYSGANVYLGSCATNTAFWIVQQLRERSEDHPALYRLVASTGSDCLRVSDGDDASIGSCDDAGRVYIEPAGWGERVYPLEYEVSELLIIKPETSVAGLSEGSLDSTLVGSVQTGSVNFLEEWISKITDGVVAVHVDTVVSTDPILSLSPAGENYLPEAYNLLLDIGNYVPFGQYDVVQAIFTPGDTPNTVIFSGTASTAGNIEINIGSSLKGINGKYTIPVVAGDTADDIGSALVGLLRSFENVIDANNPHVIPEGDQAPESVKKYGIVTVASNAGAVTLSGGSVGVLSHQGAVAGISIDLAGTRGVTGGWGYGKENNYFSNYALWTTVNAKNTNESTWLNNARGSANEVFVHEPMHGFDGYFERFDINLPDGWLHGAEVNGYGGDSGWLHWYRDYWLGTVIAADDTYRGYGPKAFREPKISEWVISDASEYRIFHSSGLCVSAGSSSKIILSDDCENAESLFLMSSSGLLEHAVNASCIYPENGSSSPEARLVYNGTCSVYSGAKFSQTSGGSIQYDLTGMCVHPLGGAAAPSIGTELVLFPACDESRLQFTFVPQ